MINVQKIKPIRVCNKNYARYTSFKPYLRNDFNKRCGYCDDMDNMSGGGRGYHIDHFKPHSIERFRLLKQTYSNLVYSCPICNGAKSNKWKDNDGFVDPCDDEYDLHIERNAIGQIKYKTEQGKYIYENLKLGLKRHELLWCISKLEEQRGKIEAIIGNLGEGHEKEVELLRLFMSIQVKINEYTELFQHEI